MLHDFQRALTFSRYRAAEYNQAKFNHEATVWIVASAFQQTFHRPISSTINAALSLEFRDEMPQTFAKVLTFIKTERTSNRGLINTFKPLQLWLVDVFDQVERLGEAQDQLLFIKLMFVVLMMKLD